MLTTTCHCGAVHIEIPAPPEALINCNCSICRRYGALWAQYEASTVRVTGHPENTVEYIWGEKTIRTLRCRHCGCVTHWEPLAASAGTKFGINIRNFEPEQIGEVRLRRFDGAETWTYLD
ncbi:GFA family protein [Pseudoduganella sp. FT55W]|uniref:GFA family protein n=1 Tax=Duganella rivi TaxID=2666083 RepID=A0A7X4GQ58_9BURK|nr:GFA family protein [Duganella rivi]MYM67081.1 GFA family protein [Duganella rivi]